MKRAPVPSSIVWEITARCNLRCAYCYTFWTAKGVEEPSTLGPCQTRQVIANIASGARGLKSLTFSGGEPLLRDDLADVVREAKKALPRAQISVATNGEFLTLERATRLKDSGVSVIQVTVLSGDPNVHDEMTGRPGTLERVLEAVANAKRAGLLVAAFFVATRRNISDFPGAAKLALAVGADTVIFNRFQPGGRALDSWKELTPGIGQLEAALAQIAELRKIAQVSFGTILPPCETLHRPVKGKDVFSCPIGTKRAYPAVGADGALRPCNHSPVIAGSLLERPLGELLQESCMSAGAAGPLPPECVGCRWSKRCRGGCPAARSLAGERIYALS